CTEPLYGISIRQARRFQTEYRPGKPKCRELCMHRRGFVRSIDGGRIAKRDVPNGHSSACQAPRANIHHRIDGDDDPVFQDRTIEDRGSRRNKRAPMDRCTGNMCMWSYEYVIPERTRMLPRTSDYRVLHDNTVLANAYRRPLSTDDRSG